MKYVTLKDIAKVANVSYATVSRALSGSREVSEETRSRVLAICREKGYTTDYVARAMVMRSTRTLGLIVTNVDNPFMSELANHIEQQARQEGFDIMLCNSSHLVAQESQVFQLLVGRRVDGIIIVPAGKESYASLSPFINQVPTLFISENIREMPVNYVSVDNYAGSVLGMEYLISLGHRSIIYFGRRQSSPTHHLRAQGYMDTCLKHGLQPRFFDNPRSTTSIQNGFELARELFSRGPRDFTAIFASSDTNALGVIKAADEAGLRIPQDVSLLGFDNISYADLPKIELSTVEQPKREMAEQAVKALVGRIRGESRDLFQLVVAPRLVVRKSCIQIAGGDLPGKSKGGEQHEAL
ncbi:MAG: LacI family DNA-binding transcriptional regulator [Christensenellales bacterium]